MAKYPFLHMFSIDSEFLAVLTILAKNTSLQQKYKIPLCKSRNELLREIIDVYIAHIKRIEGTQRIEGKKLNS